MPVVHGRSTNLPGVADRFGQHSGNRVLDCDLGCRRQFRRSAIGFVVCWRRFRAGPAVGWCCVRRFVLLRCSGSASPGVWRPVDHRAVRHQLRNRSRQFLREFLWRRGHQSGVAVHGRVGQLEHVDRHRSARGIRYYEAENPSAGDQSGWALVTADDSVAAQATFRRHTPDGHFYEAAVPSSGGYSRFVMPFDVTTFAPNGAQLFTAFAVVNLNPSVIRALRLHGDATSRAC